MTEYTLILEQGPTSWGAYCPDLPGCIAAAKTRQEVEKLYGEAAEAWIKATLEDGDAVPAPQAETDLLIIALPGHTPRRYLIILQPTPLGSWSASPADLPDLVLECSTRAETLHLLRVALQSYLETQLAAGETLPEPASEAATVAVQLAEALVAA